MGTVAVGSRMDQLPAELVSRAGRSRRPGHDAGRRGVANWREHLSLWQFQTSMPALDPPAHSRLRKLVGYPRIPLSLGARR